MTQARHVFVQDVVDYVAETERTLAFPEYFKLARIALTMVSGSVEEERVFSAMNFIKSDRRTRLQEEHMDVCVRAFTLRDLFPPNEFPFELAYNKWATMCNRRMVHD